MLFDAHCAMQDYFRATNCPAKVLFGEQHIAEHYEQLSVIWVPVVGDDFAAPTYTGASPISDMYKGLNPRTVMARWASADLHVWGFAPRQDDPARQTEKDYGVLDALVNHTLVALFVTLSLPGFRARGGRNIRGPMAVRRGYSYVLPIQVQIPIVQLSAFPCEKIGLDAFTYLEKPIDTVAVTVTEQTTIPTGTVIESVTFSVTEE